MLLKGKIAVVTGASRGIGRAICKALADEGAVIAATARSRPELESLKQEIEDRGGMAEVIPADIALEEDVAGFFSRIEADCGVPDVLVNNAGLGVYGRLESFSAEDFDRVIAVNLRGTFLCCREAVRRMIPRKSGYIINISSVVGFKGYPNQSVYTAAKHGVMGLTKSLAVESQEHGIRVSAILPGGVDTEMVRSARPDLDPSILMQPGDIAQAVLYLLSLSGKAAVDELYIRRSSGTPF